ncbi:phosphorylase family protein [Paludibacterium paludis]|nr:purine phosphorylase [Paludibacterium paludis]
MKIIILFPTATEAALFSSPEVTSLVTGVGLTATAYATLKTIHEHRPDWLILAGVAGAFAHSGLGIGDVALVESEVEADLGFFTKDGFTHLAHLPIDMEFERRHILDCPHLPESDVFKRARSISLNAAMAPFVDTREADLENMEGAAFFHVCRQEGQRFLELRAISNTVGPEADDWDLPGSVRVLTDALHRLVDVVKGAA